MRVLRNLTGRDMACPESAKAWSAGELSRTTRSAHTVATTRVAHDRHVGSTATRTANGHKNAPLAVNGSAAAPALVYCRHAREPMMNSSHIMKMIVRRTCS
jgi:hypothetical protein